MPKKLIARASATTIPITVIKQEAYQAWHDAADESVRNWLAATGFSGDADNTALLPASDGGLSRAVFVMPTAPNVWTWSGLAAALPPGSYRIDTKLAASVATDAALGWSLAGYEYTRYRKSRQRVPSLVWPTGADRSAVMRAVDGISLVRDLVTTPAEDMGPSHLAAAARALAKRHKATARVISGDQLLKQNYPAIHAVGRACDDPPRLIDIAWGAADRPKVTLVGKGVCFDTGGLDLKSAAGMKLMKKDMGGAAHVLGLASMIMAAKLPVRLRVLIGAVENSVAGNAYHPLDVLTMRNGMTVEVGNTDAEGRLVLADCLVKACEDKPELLIDFATLTGAARIALGPDLPAMYATDDALATTLQNLGDALADPVWHMPLHRDYRSLLDTTVADLSSTGSIGYGGSITAALFLAEFVTPETPWLHFDVMAWNMRSRPGRPEGGEAMGIRTVFEAIAQRFGEAAGARRSPARRRR